MNAPLKILWKLLIINILSIILVIMTVYMAFHLLASGYFIALTEKYNITPADAHAMFMAAVDRYLFIASLTGMIFASVMSFWLSYRLTQPIMYIQKAASRISDGDYNQLKIIDACGEFKQLSQSFNMMAKRLQQVDRLRKEFIVDIAHELRTPLTNICGYTEGLRDGVITPEGKVFVSIHEESQRLVRLVEDLLQLARADVARQDMEMVKFDYTQLVLKMMNSFLPKIKDRNLTLEFNNQRTIEIYADQQRVGQVLSNLLENAIRYSPSDSMIEIHVDQQGASIRTSIKNELEEKSVQLSEELFERFHRGETSRSREYGGAGLGLAIVRQLIDAHGGTVGIQTVNGKVEVWFILPAK